MVLARSRIARICHCFVLVKWILVSILVELAITCIQRQQVCEKEPVVGRYRDLQNVVQAQEGVVYQVGIPFVDVLLLFVQNDHGPNC